MYSHSLLIIDDDPNSHSLYSVTLADFRIKISSCYNGRDGYEELKSGGYDLALLDLEMPEMNGFEVLEMISRDGAEFPPTIVISAAVGNNLIERCLSLGASNYLKKPVRTGFLKAIVRDILDTVDVSKKSLARAMHEMARRKSTAFLKIKSTIGEGEIEYRLGKLISARYMGYTNISAVDLLKEETDLKIDVIHR